MKSVWLAALLILPQITQVTAAEAAAPACREIYTGVPVHTAADLKAAESFPDEIWKLILQDPELYGDLQAMEVLRNMVGGIETDVSHFLSANESMGTSLNRAKSVKEAEVIGRVMIHNVKSLESAVSVNPSLARKILIAFRLSGQSRAKHIAQRLRANQESADSLIGRMDEEHTLLLKDKIELHEKAEHLKQAIHRVEGLQRSIPTLLDNPRLGERAKQSLQKSFGDTVEKTLIRMQGLSHFAEVASEIMETNVTTLVKSQENLKVIAYTNVPMAVTKTGVSLAATTAPNKQKKIGLLARYVHARAESATRRVKLTKAERAQRRKKAICTAGNVGVCAAGSLAGLMLYNSFFVTVDSQPEPAHQIEAVATQNAASASEKAVDTTKAGQLIGVIDPESIPTINYLDLYKDLQSDADGNPIVPDPAPGQYSAGRQVLHDGHVTTITKMYANNKARLDDGAVIAVGTLPISVDHFLWMRPHQLVELNDQTDVIEKVFDEGTVLLKSGQTSNLYEVRIQIPPIENYKVGQRVSLGDLSIATIKNFFEDRVVGLDNGKFVSINDIYKQTTELRGIHPQDQIVVQNKDYTVDSVYEDGTVIATDGTALDITSVVPDQP